MSWACSSLQVRTSFDYLVRDLIRFCRFERAQYTEVRTAWGSSQGPLSGKSAVDTYGAEHLSRLLGKLRLNIWE